MREGEARGKICRRCSEFYPSEKFKITSRKFSGKIYYKSTCANCIAEETRAALGDTSVSSATSGSATSEITRQDCYGLFGT